MQHWSPLHKKMIPAGPSGLICLSAEKERTNSPSSSSWNKSPGAGSSLNGNLTDRGKHCKKMLFEGSDDTTVTEVDEFKYAPSPNSKAVNELTSSVTQLNVTNAVHSVQDGNVGYFQPQMNGTGSDEQSTVGKGNTSPNVLDSMIEATAVAMGCKPVKPLPHLAENGMPQKYPSFNGSSPGVPGQAHQSTPASIPRAVLCSGDEILKWVEASYELARKREAIPGVPDIRIPFSVVANKKEGSRSIMMPVVKDGTELSEDEDEYSNPYIAMHTKLSSRLHIEALHDIKDPKPSTSSALRGQIKKMRSAAARKEKLIKKAVTNGNGATSSSPRIFHGTDEEIAEIEQMFSSPRKSARKRSIRDRDADDESSLPNGDAKDRSSETSNKQNMAPPKRKVLTPKVHSRRNVDPLRPVTASATGQPLKPKNKPSRSQVIQATPSPPPAKPSLTAQSLNTPTSTKQVISEFEGRGFRVKKLKLSQDAQEKLKQLKSHKAVGMKPLTNVTKHSSHQARARNGKNFVSNGGSETAANVSSAMPPMPRQGEASIRPKHIKTEIEVTDRKPASTDASHNNESTDEETASAEAATVQQTINTEPETTTAVVTLSPRKMPMLQLEHVKIGKRSANTVEMPTLERQETIKKAIATESKSISNGIKMESKSTAQPTSNVAVILPKPEFPNGKRRKKDEPARVHKLRQRSELTLGKNVTVEEVREVKEETSRKNVDGSRSSKLNVKNLKKDKDSGCILPVMTNGNHPKQNGIDGKDNIRHCSITENAVPKLEARRHTRLARPKTNTEDSHHFRNGCGSSKSGGFAEIEVGREVAKENQIEAEMLSPPAEPRAVSEENPDDIEVDKKVSPEKETDKKVNAEPVPLSLFPVVRLQQIIQPQPREATEEGVSKSKKRKNHPEYTSGASPSNSEPDYVGSEPRKPVLDSPCAQKDLIGEENGGTSCHSSKPLLEAETEESKSQCGLPKAPSSWSRNLKLCPLQLVIKLVRVGDQREWKDKIRSILNNNNRDHHENGSERRMPSTSAAVPNGDNPNGNGTSGDGDSPPTSPPTTATTATATALAAADGGSPEETGGTRRSIRAKKPSKLVDGEDWVR